MYLSKRVVQSKSPTVHQICNSQLSDAPNNPCVRLRGGWVAICFPERNNAAHAVHAHPIGCETPAWSHPPSPVVVRQPICGSLPTGTTSTTVSARATRVGCARIGTHCSAHRAEPLLHVLFVCIRATVGYFTYSLISVLK